MHIGRLPQGPEPSARAPLNPEPGIATAPMSRVQASALRYLDPHVISRLKSMDLRARLAVEGFITGLHRSPYHGFSVEFAEHRPYNPGDELRHVDWKVFGKTDRHYVKQYEEETNLRHYVVLDTSPSMRYRRTGSLTKLAYGAYLAAALHYLMIRQRDATGLIGFDESVHTLLRPRCTASYMRRILAELERFTTLPSAGRRTHASAALHEVAERIHRRSFVVVITDLMENVGAAEDLVRALRHLRHRGHEVLVFRILEADTESKFNFENVPMVFRDMETGEEMSLHPAQLREAFVRTAQEFSARFRRRCLEQNVEFVELDTEESYGTALLSYLNKRRRLK